MKKISEIFHLFNPGGDVGIEIEVEGKNLKMTVPTATFPWKTEDDGSLRGVFPNERSEYVLIKPIPIRLVNKAVSLLSNYQKEAQLDFSFRTSVHVHVNVCDLYPFQLNNFIYTYLLLEEPLVNFCGKERINNRFCLRLQDAGTLRETVSNILSHGVEFALHREAIDNMRYSAINLVSVPQYGSLEFRSMRGTLDPAIIDTWAKTLISIRKYAIGKKSLAEIYNELNELGPIEFMRKVLGDLSVHYETPDVKDQILLSQSLTIDLPFMANVYKYKENDDEDF